MNRDHLEEKKLLKNTHKHTRVKVYHIPSQRNYSLEKALFSLEATLEHRMFKLLSRFRDSDLIGIKLDLFNDEHSFKVDPGYVSTVVDVIQNHSVVPFVCDTSRRYRRMHVTAPHYIQEAWKLGYAHDRINAPFLMLDGLNGQYEFAVHFDEMNQQKTAWLAGELQNIDGLIFISNLKRSELAGFNGAIYNLGVGLASRKGKIRHYTMNKPFVNATNCHTCRKCMRVCPTRAISLGEHSVIIDRNACIDCGKCVETAYFGGIRYKWNATPMHFQKKMVEHSRGTLEILKKKVLFINILNEQADGQEVTNKDQVFQESILISTDPLAIDLACYDLLQKNEQERSGRLSVQDNQFQVMTDYAKNLRLGNPDYELVPIAY